MSDNDGIEIQPEYDYGLSLEENREIYWSWYARTSVQRDARMYQDIREAGGLAAWHSQGETSRQALMESRSALYQMERQAEETSRLSS